VGARGREAERTSGKRRGRMPSLKGIRVFSKKKGRQKSERELVKTTTDERDSLRGGRTSAAS